MRLNSVNQSKSLVNEQNHKAIAAFLYYLKNKAFLKGKKPSKCTIDAYLSTLSLFFQDVQKPYTDVTTEDIRKWLYNCRLNGLHPHTVTLYLQRIKQFFKTYTNLGKIPRNPAEPIEGFGGYQPSRIYLPLEKLPQFMNLVSKYIDEPYKTMLLLFPMTGFRAQEMLNLKLKDITKKGGLVCLSVLGKGGRRREVPLFPEAHDILYDYFVNYRRHITNRKSDYIFIRKDGTRAEYRPLYNRLQVIARILKIKGITPHKLRHTFATYLRSLGVDLKVVQELLGHQAFKTTVDIYAHVTTEEKEEAVTRLAEIFKKKFTRE